MSSLLSKLSLLLSDQYKNPKGVRRDIKFLSDEQAEMLIRDSNELIRDMGTSNKGTSCTIQIPIIILFAHYFVYWKTGTRR